MKKGSVRKILIWTTLISLIISTFVLVSQAIEPNTLSNKKIKILIVAGHEPDAGGADEFKAIKERDLNLQLSIELKKDLEKDNNIEVTMVRDENGWNKELESYVKTNKTEIMKWVSESKQKMLAKVDAGDIEIINPDLKHNEAATNAVLFLYGTNKWIEEKNIDVVFHVHFNNNPKYKGKPNYRGYAIYVPEKQFSNSSSSKIFANYLNEEMYKIQKKSNMPQEKETVIESQELIAVGSYETLKIPSAVIEYAYIYEPIMLSSSTRNNFINKAASSTAVAIEKYVSEVFQK